MSGFYLVGEDGLSYGVASDEEHAVIFETSCDMHRTTYWVWQLVKERVALYDALCAKLRPDADEDAIVARVNAELPMPAEAGL